MAELFDYVGYEQKGYRITQDSQIPMTRGLGSSSACIIGGMLAANIISGRQLSYQEIIHLAATMEGHPTMWDRHFSAVSACRLWMMTRL